MYKNRGLVKVSHERIQHGKDEQEKENEHSDEV
jgi:hypothetical protein